MYRDLTEGPILRTLLLFSLPLMAGNLLQQCYNLADTFLVGRVLGSDPLAAVGASYSLLVFLTSILLGLCMGAGAFFAICQGRRDEDRLRAGIVHAFLLIAALTALLTAGVYGGIDPILHAMHVPGEVLPFMRTYLLVIFSGIAATFLYNFFACLLRALGNSLLPLVFLGVSSLLNIALDLLFLLRFSWGVGGAAAATVIAQYLAGIGIALYALWKEPSLRPRREDFRWNGAILREIGSLSLLTCLQQSVMNFGILMIQSLVNSFGPAVMAAFSAAVKIDAFAYLPAQDFGNAFSSFVSQNYGAGKPRRIRAGFRAAAGLSMGYCLAASLVICLAARPLMQLFLQPQETEILLEGVRYLRIEGAFYFGIGWLFLLYGLYRAVRRPAMSVVLTVLSLGTRVALAYALAPVVGVTGIWWAIPIGWGLADAAGLAYYRLQRERLLTFSEP